MLVTKQAPAFKTMAVMPDNSITEVSLSDYKGKKVVLFFYPSDFEIIWIKSFLIQSQNMHHYSFPYQ